MEKRTLRRFTAQEKYQVLQEGEYGSMSINEVCRRHQISTVTYYGWRKQARTAMLNGLNHRSGAKSSSGRERELEAELGRLRNTIVEITKENIDLKKKNFR